ncbi:prolipoprotein diacylglyceryl transferase [Cellulosilyticum sp. I15G10I2]|uniref:prolipoprotein diacylglyceryl transferase n=1 Tax=Cellulosilyticum sp. I15G10I2 TaxID=1892843 RepID=UPI00085CA7BD|nr:prolipoprotein diacylglyceryl transferase [Cellulosilyticum sp. I15G10I2]
MPNIYFPHLNLQFNINSAAFEIFGVSIYWYGLIITTGILLGTVLASYIARQEGLDSEIMIDFILYNIIFALIGARIYYVIFNFSYYKDNLLQIFNIRQGGLAIYGGVIVSVIVAIIYTKKKNIKFWLFADCATYGLVLGQAIGRYGNFANKEAFGDYTNSLFAMRILKTEAKLPFSENILNNLQVAFGEQYIQVHPTFFYESCWNIGLLILLLIYRRYRKAYGEIFLLYLIGYGIGRFWIEGLRTDQLLLGNTQIAISQVVAILSIIMGIIGIKMCRNYSNKS